MKFIGIIRGSLLLVERNLTVNVNSLPARSGTEDLSSLPVDPGCGKRSENTILKGLQIRYIKGWFGHSTVTLSFVFNH